MSQLQSTDPSLLLAMGQHGLSLAGVVSALSFASIGFAFLGVPQVLTRFIAARDQDQLLTGSLLAVICIVVFETGAVFSGMAGRALFPGLSDHETILPTMSTELFPPSSLPSSW